MQAHGSHDLASGYACVEIKRWTQKHNPCGFQCFFQNCQVHEQQQKNPKLNNTPGRACGGANVSSVAKNGVTTPIAAEAGEEKAAATATPAADEDANNVLGSSGGGGGARAAAIAMAKDGRNKKEASLGQVGRREKTSNKREAKTHQVAGEEKKKKEL